MKKILFLMFVFVLMVGCKNNPTNPTEPVDETKLSDIYGNWVGLSGEDDLYIDKDGNYEYTGDNGCETSGTWTHPGIMGEKSIDLTITYSTVVQASPLSHNCLPTGGHFCYFKKLDNDKILFGCGDYPITPNQRVYQKQ